MSTSLKSTALYSWGSETSSYYTIRSNDDVYLDWGGVVEAISNLVPARVYGPLVIPGNSMRIPRPRREEVRSEGSERGDLPGASL